MNFFEQARHNMVCNQVMTNKVFDKHLLALMKELPRHEFVDKKLVDIAYTDARIKITEHRELLAPEVFARMVQALELKQDETIIDIACGLGYSSIIQSFMCKTVVAIDSIISLSSKAVDLIKKYGKGNITFKVSDLFSGDPEHAPFDAILINGAVNRVPEVLTMQLKEGGRMVVIESINGIMKAVKYHKVRSQLTRMELFDAYASFV